MDWLWIATAAGWVLALLAYAVARRATRRLDQLTQQYWELKYEHGELKARVRAIAPTPDEIAASQPAPQQTFVPLSSVKRS